MTSPGDGLIEAIAEAVALKLERMNSTSQRLMEIEEAAKYLGMTAPALRQKAAAGEVPVVRIDNKIRFETARQVFADPHVIIVEDCEDEHGEMRYHAIGRAGAKLLLVVFADRSTDEREVLHII